MLVILDAFVGELVCLLLAVVETLPNTNYYQQRDYPREHTEVTAHPWWLMPLLIPALNLRDLFFAVSVAC